MNDTVLVDYNKYPCSRLFLTQKQFILEKKHLGPAFNKDCYIILNKKTLTENKFFSGNKPLLKEDVEILNEEGGFLSVPAIIKSLHVVYHKGVVEKELINQAEKAFKEADDPKLKKEIEERIQHLKNNKTSYIEAMMNEVGTEEKYTAEFFDKFEASFSIIKEGGILGFLKNLLETPKNFLVVLQYIGKFLGKGIAKLDKKVAKKAAKKALGAGAFIRKSVGIKSKESTEEKNQDATDTEFYDPKKHRYSGTSADKKGLEFVNKALGSSNNEENNSFVNELRKTVALFMGLFSVVGHLLHHIYQIVFNFISSITVGLFTENKEILKAVSALIFAVVVGILLVKGVAGGLTAGASVLAAKGLFGASKSALNAISSAMSGIKSSWATTIASIKNLGSVFQTVYAKIVKLKEMFTFTRSFSDNLNLPGKAEKGMDKFDNILNTLEKYKDSTIGLIKGIMKTKLNKNSIMKGLKGAVSSFFGLNRKKATNENYLLETYIKNSLLNYSH